MKNDEKYQNVTTRLKVKYTEAIDAIRLALPNKPNGSMLTRADIMRKAITAYVNTHPDLLRRGLKAIKDAQRPL